MRLSVVRLAALLACGIFAAHSGAAAPSEKVIHSFCSGETRVICSDGSKPRAALVNVNNTLYGTTSTGGANGRGGVVFSVNPASGAETVLYSFCGQSGCADGATPLAGLIAVKGALYGTTLGGGTFGYGTVFSIDPGTGAESTLYSFKNNGTDGDGPFAPLVKYEGELYGTTAYGGPTKCNNGGGPPGCGTVFSIRLKDGVERIVYSFQDNGADGDNSLAGLTVVGGSLFGTTSTGGTGNCNWPGGCGTVFSVDPKTGVENVVYSFCSQQNCADGERPEASLIDVNGTLYGTTVFGGTYDRGTVFSINPATGAEAVVYSFHDYLTDGVNPIANLIEVGGMLYGTTAAGGSNSIRCLYYCGTVFSLDPGTGTETILYTFCFPHKCSDGINPSATVSDVNGTLYGTTYNGGGSTSCGKTGCGTVFSLQLNDRNSKPIGK
jgi:uncharacterized repeat protein (TIGR03803 family)